MSGDSGRRTELKISEGRGERDAYRRRYAEIAPVVSPRGERSGCAAQPHGASQVADDAVIAGPVSTVPLRVRETVGGCVVGNYDRGCAGVTVVRGVAVQEQVQ